MRGPSSLATPSVLILLAVIVLLPLLAGCGGSQATEYYRDESINRLETHQLQFSGDVNESCYSDTMVDITLQVNNEDTTSFQFSLSNKTSEPVVVLWNQVVFVDASGNRQNIIHQGLRYWDPLSRLEPVAIPPFTTVTDLIRPAKVDYRDGAPRLAPLRGLQDTSRWLDQRISIDLPLVIYGKTSIYRFRMHIEQPPLMDDPNYDPMYDPFNQAP